MRRLMWILAFMAVCLASQPALAQYGNIYAVTTCGSGAGFPSASPGNLSNFSVSLTGKLCADVSVALSGFAPATTGTPISVTTGGASGTLPTGTVVVASNVGTTNSAYCKLGASATTADQLIAPNSWFAFTVGAATQLTCITSTSTTTVNMVGGSGLPTGAGGGGGGGSGSSAAVGPTGSSVPTSADFIGLNNAGTLVGAPGDNTNGLWVNIKASALGATQGALTSLLTGQSIMGAATTTAPTYVTGNSYFLSLLLDGATRVANHAEAEGGSLSAREIAPNNNTCISLKAAAGTAYGAQLGGIGAVPAYVKLYDTASTPTAGSGTPIKTLIIPANATAALGAGSNVTFGPAGVKFSSGLGYCVVTDIADSGTTAPPAATYIVNIDYF